MSHAQERAIQRYQSELRRALKGVDKQIAEAALSDALESLSGEAQTYSNLECDSERRVYQRLAGRFGTPAQFAAEYLQAEPGAVAARCSTGWPFARLAALAAVALLMIGVASSVCLALFQEPPKVSPFTKVEYEGERVIVEHEGKEYEWLALDGVPTSEIVAAAKAFFGPQWQKRVAEDLVEVLHAMDRRPGARVELRLKDRQTNAEKTVANAPMTEANRSQIWTDRNGETWAEWVANNGPLGGRAAGADRAPKLSPFTNVEFNADRVIVEHAGKEYEWLAIDGLPIDKILASAKQQFGERWEKRVAEDLVEVLWGMGHKPQPNVELRLRDPESGDVTTLAAAPMTEVNRLAVWARRQAEAERQAKQPPKLSPFTKVEFDGDRVVVDYNGQDFEWLALDGHPTKTVIATAKQQFGDKWQKRVAEDLVEVLWAMGHKPEITVQLVLRDPKTGAEKTVADAPMTRDNRQAVRAARR